MQFGLAVIYFKSYAAPNINTNLIKKYKLHLFSTCDSLDDNRIKSDGISSPFLTWTISPTLMSLHRTSSNLIPRNTSTLRLLTSPSAILRFVSSKISLHAETKRINDRGTRVVHRPGGQSNIVSPICQAALYLFVRSSACHASSLSVC